MKIPKIISALSRLWIGGAVLLACVVLGPATAPPAWAAEPGAAPAEPKTIVVLGDSLAAGFGVDPSEAFPALLQSKIDAAKWNFKWSMRGSVATPPPGGCDASIGCSNAGLMCSCWNSEAMTDCAASPWKPP